MADQLWVKICGVTRAEDVGAAAEAGADAVGLNFYPASPRYLAADAARALVRTAPPGLDLVAVFVNRPLGEMAEQAGALGRVAACQCHGTPEVPTDVLPMRLIPAFPVRDADGLRAVEAYLARCRAAGRLPAAVLIDGHAPGRFGGTGRTAPWALLGERRWEVPMILAGGLTPENVAEAVRVARPFGVDVAGGVEDAPGRKCADRVRRFVGNARDAAAKYGTWARPTEHAPEGPPLAGLMTKELP